MTTKVTIKQAKKVLTAITDAFAALDAFGKKADKYVRPLEQRSKKLQDAITAIPWDDNTRREERDMLQVEADLVDAVIGDWQQIDAFDPNNGNKVTYFIREIVNDEKALAKFEAKKAKLTKKAKKGKR